MADEMKAAGPVRMAAIENMMSDIRYKAQILARTNKIESGIIDSGLLGFSIGLILMLVLVVVPMVLLV